LGDLNNTAEGDIHSRNKSILGTRLTILVLYNQYGQTDLLAYGPVASRVIFSSGNPSPYITTLTFNTTGDNARYSKGLHLLDTAECTTCCESVDGSPVQYVLSDKSVVRAIVTLNDTAMVASAEIPQGVRVEQYWFNYEAYPQCSLYNSATLPLLPFATIRPPTS